MFITTNPIMKQNCLLLIAHCLFLISLSQVTKAPAYPLITHDPYFSIWSFSDKLNESSTKHWTGMDHSLSGLISVDGKVYNFMGMPEMPVKTLLPPGEAISFECKFTEDDPGAYWMKENYAATNWKLGKAPFGWGGDNNAATDWKSKSIWMRKEFVLSETDVKNIALQKLILQLRHDDDVEVYINEELAYSCKNCYLDALKDYPLSEQVTKKLRKGRNLIALHCINPNGYAWLDAGLGIQEQVKGITPAIQKTVTMTATQTRYQFTCGGVDLELNFLSPLLLNDLDLISRPVSYMNVKIKSNDENTHETNLCIATSTNLVRNSSAQTVSAKWYDKDQLSILKSGTLDQPVLKKKGDDLRIDWGYLYIATPSGIGIQSASESAGALKRFLTTGKSYDKIASGDFQTLNNDFYYKNLDKNPVEYRILFAYDDVNSVQYFGENLKAWWTLKDASIEEQIKQAEM
jgi:Domain of unknown function (DUF5127)/Domain of unknown function (DUF4964)